MVGVVGVWTGNLGDTTVKEQHIWENVAEKYSLYWIINQSIDPRNLYTAFFSLSFYLEEIETEPKAVCS